MHCSQTHSACDDSDRDVHEGGEWAGDFDGGYLTSNNDGSWEHSTPQPAPLNLDMMEMPAQAVKGQVCACLL